MNTLLRVRRFALTELGDMIRSLRASPVFALAVLLTLVLAGVNGVMILIMQLQPGFLGMAHFADPNHRVHDLTFGFIFVPGIVGILAQLRRPSKNVAGMLMALVPWVALLVTLVLTLVLTNNARVLGPQWAGVASSTFIAALLHPTWRDVFRSFRVSRINWMMIGLVVIVAVPLLALASNNVGLQGTVPDDHALMGHYGFMAAFAFTVIGVGLVASLRPDGWRLTAWVAASLPALLGFTSLAYPDVPSSLGLGWAVAAIAWGAAFVAVAERTKGAVSTVGADVSPDRARSTGTPRWVNVIGGTGIVVIVAFYLVLFIGGGPTGGGGHGPNQGGPGLQASFGTCQAEPYENPGGSGARVICEGAEGAGRTAQEFTCRAPDDHGGLEMGWDIEAGEVTVTVRDAVGTTVFSDTYSGQGEERPDFSQGQAGSWEVEAERGDGFAGSFTVQTFCAAGSG